MTKTQNFNLNKPEVTDSIRVSDFNENAEIIDGLLNTLNTSVAALNTAAAGFGNCKIASGSYTGNGKYGSSNPTKLNVGFAPKIVLIAFEGNRCRLFLPIFDERYDLGSTFSSEAYTLIWGNTYFGMYSGSAYGQMNDSGRVYSYIVIG